jgi:hypothetical protein
VLLGCAGWWGWANRLRPNTRRPVDSDSDSDQDSEHAKAKRYAQRRAAPGDAHRAAGTHRANGTSRKRNLYGALEVHKAR